MNTAARPTTSATHPAWKGSAPIPASSWGKLESHLQRRANRRRAAKPSTPAPCTRRCARQAWGGVVGGGCGGWVWSHVPLPGRKKKPRELGDRPRRFWVSVVLSAPVLFLA